MSHNEHFAELAYNLKQNKDATRHTIVSEWYIKHYADKVHYPSLAQILVNYVEENNFLRMSDLFMELRPDNFSFPNFSDLSEGENQNFYVRTIAICCSTITLLECKKIPAYEKFSNKYHTPSQPLNCS